MPGTRHAKNCTALGFFTKSERERMHNWGDKEVRLGADSVKQWDACGLCLKLPRDPLCCAHGDIFCKLCIYACLVQQKDDIKRKREQYEAQQREEENKELRKQQEKDIEKVMQFYRLETGSIADMSKRGARNVVRLGEDDIGSLATKSRKTVAQEVAEEETKLSCFWIPNLIPDHSKKQMQAPSKHTFCPCCNKKLRKKKLKPVNFTPIQGREGTPSEPGEQNYSCCSCRKTFTNVHKKYHLRRCGHVVCKDCVTRLFVKERSCPKCSEPFSKKDLVMLKNAGTGFVASGAQAVAKKVGISFQS